MARASACSLTCEVASWHGEHRRGRERWPIGFDGRRHVVRQGVCGLRPGEGGASAARAGAPPPQPPWREGGGGAPVAWLAAHVGAAKVRLRARARARGGGPRWRGRAAAAGSRGLAVCARPKKPPETLRAADAARSQRTLPSPRVGLCPSAPLQRLPCAPCKPCDDGAASPC